MAAATIAAEVREQRDFALGMFGSRFAATMAAEQAILKARHAKSGGNLIACAQRLAAERLRAGHAPTPMMAAAVELVEGRDYDETLRRTADGPLPV